MADLSDTSSKMQEFFLGHLSMDTKAVSWLCTVSVGGVCVCVHEYFIADVSYASMSCGPPYIPLPHQMFVKLNPWMAAIEDGAHRLYCV